MESANLSNREQPRVPIADGWEWRRVGYVGTNIATLAVVSPLFAGDLDRWWNERIHTLHDHPLEQTQQVTLHTTWARTWEPDKSYDDTEHALVFATPDNGGYEIWALYGPHPYSDGEAIWEITIKLHYLDVENYDEPPIAPTLAVHHTLGHDDDIDAEWEAQYEAEIDAYERALATEGFEGTIAHHDHRVRSIAVPNWVSAHSGGSRAFVDVEIVALIGQLWAAGCVTLYSCQGTPPHDDAHVGILLRDEAWLRTLAERAAIRAGVQHCTLNRDMPAAYFHFANADIGRLTAAVRDSAPTRDRIDDEEGPDGP